MTKGNMNKKIYDTLEKIISERRTDSIFIKQVNLELIKRDINPILLTQLMNGKKTLKDLSQQQLKGLIDSLYEILHFKSLIEDIDNTKNTKSTEEEERRFIRVNDNPTTFNKYQKVKYDWLINSDYSYNSRKSFWTIFKTYVIPYEEAKGKDIYNFSTTEIKTLLNASNITSRAVKKSVWSCIKRYIDYAMEEGLTKVKENPCIDIDINEIINYNEQTIKGRYQTLPDFYKWLDTLYATDVDKIILTMLRYGVEPKDIGNVRWGNVNREQKTLSVIRTTKEENTETITVLTLPIDEEFVRRVDKAKSCNKNLSKNRTIKYIDYGYIAKVYENSFVDQMTTSTLFSKLNDIADKSGCPKINKKDLTISRYCDLALEVINKRGVLERPDIVKIMETFGNKITPSTIFKTKKELQQILGIEVPSYQNKWQKKKEQ